MSELQLGSLEKQVLEFLWERKGARLKQVWEHFKKKKGLAYTTVFTVLQRLVRKGLVEKKEGRYFPVYSKEDFSANLFKEFLDNFVNNFGELAYSSFAQGIEKLDRQSKKKLLEKLEEMLKNEG